VSLSAEYVKGFSDAIEFVTTASKVATERVKKATEENNADEVALMTSVAISMAAVADEMAALLKVKQALP
jgi:hypothetical protein